MGFNIGDYYMVRSSDNRAIAGPLPSRVVVAMIIAKGDQSEQAKYYNASRYMLAKIKAYPRTKDGDARLVADVAAAEQGHEADANRPLVVCGALGHVIG